MIKDEGKKFLFSFLLLSFLLVEPGVGARLNIGVYLYIPQEVQRDNREKKVTLTILLYARCYTPNT